MANDQSALCEHARTILDKYEAVPTASLSPDDAHAIIALCAAWVNMCESTTLAVTRADNAQKIAESEARHADKVQRFADRVVAEHTALAKRAEALQSELSRTQAAYHALLSGAA